MGSEKIFMFGEPTCGCGGGSKADLTAILPALMNNNKGIDPGILAMLGDKNRDGFGGNDFFALETARWQTRSLHVAAMSGPLSSVKDSRTS